MTYRIDRRSWSRQAAAMLAAIAIGLPPLMAHADSGDAEANPASPRIAAEFGGFSVVLIEANGKLLAFVDRGDDNAPASDVALSLLAPDGRPAVALDHLGAGLFAAAWTPRPGPTLLHARIAPAGSARLAEGDLALPGLPTATVTASLSASSSLLLPLAGLLVVAAMIPLAWRIIRRRPSSPSGHDARHAALRRT